MSTSKCCYNKPASKATTRLPEIMKFTNVTMAREDKSSQGHLIIHGFFPKNKIVTPNINNSWVFNPKTVTKTLDSDKI